MCVYPGSDNFSALDKELAAKFAERNRSVELENARFQQSNETLQSEIQSLENSEGYLQNLQVFVCFVWPLPRSSKHCCLLCGR